MRGRPPSRTTLAAAWRPYVETCIEAFGAERCMFESNFPVDRFGASVSGALERVQAYRGGLLGR